MKREHENCGRDSCTNLDFLLLAKKPVLRGRALTKALAAWFTVAALTIGRFQKVSRVFFRLWFSLLLQHCCDYLFYYAKLCIRISLLEVQLREVKAFFISIYQTQRLPSSATSAAAVWRPRLRPTVVSPPAAKAEGRRTHRWSSAVETEAGAASQRSEGSRIQRARRLATLFLPNIRQTF